MIFLENIDEITNIVSSSKKGGGSAKMSGSYEVFVLQLPETRIANT